ncbi:MAG TPA: family 10 glycosylhydrolase, partial [Pyrinomonadaceae bacterium]|nr:family 10 glycosylhydrolase [Pyrinomonadaceae bacterium]
MQKPKENTEALGRVNRRRFLQTSIALAGVGATLSNVELNAQLVTTEQIKPTDVKQFVPMGSGRPIYVSDLNSCTPSPAMSKKWQKNKWKILDFETVETKGTMLVSGQNTTPPEVKYKFKQKGWYAVYIALYSYRYYSRIQVKTKNDSVFSILTQRDEVWRRQYEEGKGIFFPNKIEELFWKYADLTDEEITFKTLSIQSVPEDEFSVGNVNNAAWVPYIKLVPLSEKEVKEIKKDQKQKESRRLIATHDVFTAMCWMRWTKEEDIQREIEPFRNTDFFRLEWEAGMGDVTYYPSKIGRNFTLDWQENHYSQIHRQYSEAHQELRRKKIDPFGVAVDATHQAGLEFYAAYRPSGFLFPPPEDEWNADGFFAQNPQWHTKNKEGRETPRLSYAFPEVREYVISLLNEIATNYPIDGISLSYCRRPPFLEYEQPVVEGFIKEYGEDPLRLPDENPRWLEYRSRFMTIFMRGLRKTLNETARKQGRI